MTPQPQHQHAEPVSFAEWQTAVDAAHASLALDAARQYGLVTGGPTVHIGRCTEILARGATIGITPRPDAIERFMSEITGRRS